MDTPHLSFEISFPALEPFLDHWARQYRDAARDERLYNPHIGTAKLRTDRHALEDLFKWKNGVDKIAERKLASIHTNYFDEWTEDADLESRYLDPEKRGGPIWNIFYLHCRCPKRYPIYDQNAYRAMRYIRDHVISGDLSTKSRRFIYESYTQTYQPFVAAIDRDPRTIDRALYTFGQFLKMAKPFWRPQPGTSDAP
jgi:hypothetical protein